MTKTGPGSAGEPTEIVPVGPAPAHACPRPQGDPGQAIVANELTASNPAYGGVNVVDVVDVPSLTIDSGGPSSAEGADLVDPIELPAGEYLVTSAVQFFDFQPTDPADVDYGVARLFLDGTEVPVSTSWTSEVPDDGNNAAQSSGSILVTVPDGGGTLTARGALRGGDGGQAGASVIVSQIG